MGTSEWPTEFLYSPITIRYSLVRSFTGIAALWTLKMRAIKPIERLVPVSYMHYCTSTPGLSTWSSSTVLKGILVLRWVSRLDAFSDVQRGGFLNRSDRWSGRVAAPCSSVEPIGSTSKPRRRLPPTSIR